MNVTVSSPPHYAVNRAAANRIPIKCKPMPSALEARRRGCGLEFAVAADQGSKTDANSKQWGITKLLRKLIEFILHDLFDLN